MYEYVCLIFKTLFENRLVSRNETPIFVVSLSLRT